jgi:hypothetical protein
MGNTTNAGDRLMGKSPAGRNQKGTPMIKVYFHHTPNPLKVVLFLEETGLDYELVPVDIYKGRAALCGFSHDQPERQGSGDRGYPRIGRR